MVSLSQYRSSYSTHRFAKSVIPESYGHLDFDASDLARAIFTTGRAPADWFGHGEASFFEFVHRVSLIPAYLRNRGFRIVRSLLLESLDRSEKVAISYALGAAMSSLFTEKCLGVWGLLHIDRYGRDANLAFTSPQRPDYFGIGTGGWVVVESKGRSRGVPAVLLRHLASQKNAVGTINGTDPWVRAGVVANFATGRLSVEAIDPPPRQRDSPEPVPVQIHIDRFVFQYYRPFVRVLERGEPFEPQEGVLAVSFPAIGVDVGLHREILGLIPTSLGEGERGWAQRLIERIGSGFGQEVGLKIDGSYFATEWSEALAARDLY